MTLVSKLSESTDLGCCKIFFSVGFQKQTYTHCSTTHCATHNCFYSFFRVCWFTTNKLFILFGLGFSLFNQSTNVLIFTFWVIGFIALSNGNVSLISNYDKQSSLFILGFHHAEKLLVIFQRLKMVFMNFAPGLFFNFLTLFSVNIRWEDLQKKKNKKTNVVLRNCMTNAIHGHHPTQYPENHELCSWPLLQFPYSLFCKHQVRGPAKKKTKKQM